MNHVAAPRAQPTDAQMREAWSRLAERFHWQGDFDAAMADPICSKLVSMDALHPPGPPAEATVVDTPPERAGSTQSSRPVAPRFHNAPLPPGFIDFKRRASGERDDD